MNVDQVLIEQVAAHGVSVVDLHDLVFAGFSATNCDWADWRSHVPIIIAVNWKHLEIQTRAATFLTAKVAAMWKDPKERGR